MFFSIIVAFNNFSLIDATARLVIFAIIPQFIFANTPFKDTVVYKALPSLHGGSIEITHTVQFYRSQNLRFLLFVNKILSSVRSRNVVQH